MKMMSGIDWNIVNWLRAIKTDFSPSLFVKRIGAKLGFCFCNFNGNGRIHQPIRASMELPCQMIFCTTMSATASGVIRVMQAKSPR